MFLLISSLNEELELNFPSLICLLISIEFVSGLREASIDSSRLTLLEAGLLNPNYDSVRLKSTSYIDDL